MLKLKTVFFSSVKEIDASVNEFLTTIDEDSFRDLKVKEDKGIAFILYEAKEAWKDRMCSECQYWDDGNSSDSVSGLCHECGGRRRFNCRACDRFKDVRE
jgi:hypothetical protein